MLLKHTLCCFVRKDNFSMCGKQRPDLQSRRNCRTNSAISSFKLGEFVMLKTAKSYSSDYATMERIRLT